MTIILIIIGYIFIGWGCARYYFDTELSLKNRTPIKLYSDGKVSLGISTTPIASHIVSIKGEDFNKLFAYANKNNITVATTLGKIISSWDSTFNSPPIVQSIVWRPADIASQNVQINLIRRKTSSPATYEVIRTLATSTPNVGGFSWVKTPDDMKPDTFVEIGCVFSENECKSLPITESL